MTYTIIGTGNMAWFLGKRLTAGGHQCMGVYGRNLEVAQSLAEALMSKEFAPISEIADGDADICFLAVSDHAIASIATQFFFKKTVLVHTAGSVKLESIEKAAKDRGIFWPLYSILKDHLPSHRNIPCGWEASSAKAERYILQIGHAVTDVLFEAKSEQRKWLHLCAVVGNNFINHLMAITEQICIENKLPFSVIVPIIEQTFERVKNVSPSQVQTGPARRRDTSTIHEHTALLRSHQHWQRIYEAMSESIEAMYRTQAHHPPAEN